MTVRLLQGDCRQRLAALPAGSVHCCVTSPPYWSLRDYGVPPSVWGGEKDCGHSWSDGQYCRLCNAWRGALGLEPTPEQYVANLVEVFAHVWRALRNDGTLWLNLGDSYAANSGQQRAQNGFPSNRAMNRQAVCASSAHRGGSIKAKDLWGMPWRVAFALQEAGWYLRSDIIWSKPNPIPESVLDRPTRAHEYLFLLAKSKKYYYDAEAIRLPPSGISGGACFGGPLKEAKAAALVGSSRLRTQQRAATPEDRKRYATSGANARSVWTIVPTPFAEAHFATFPPELAERCIAAATSEQGCCPKCGRPWIRLRSVARTFESGHVDTLGWSPVCGCAAGQPVPCIVLDPFGGAGTTGLVAERLGRNSVLCELNPEYLQMARRRILADAPLLASVVTDEGEGVVDSIRGVTGSLQEDSHANDLGIYRVCSR